MGIHRLAPAATAELREAQVQALLGQGGYLSLDRQKVYFFGIIDVLERFDLRWRIQGAALTAGYHLLCRPADADGISALPPSLYADRFHTFVRREVVTPPSCHHHVIMKKSSRGHHAAIAQVLHLGEQSELMGLMEEGAAADPSRRGPERRASMPRLSDGVLRSHLRWSRLWQVARILLIP